MYESVLVLLLLLPVVVVVAVVVGAGAESSRLASIFQTPLGKCAKWLLTNTFA